MRGSAYSRRHYWRPALAIGVLFIVAMGYGLFADKTPIGIKASPAVRTVAKASCGAGDRIERGLQGQTSLQERYDGTSEDAYYCNLQLVGQFLGEGASWQMAAIDHCAYYGTGNDKRQLHPGVVVVDVSEAARPKAVQYLTDSVMLDPWESLKINVRRGLLAAVEGGPNGYGGPHFSIYDVADCAHPKLLSSIRLPGDLHGHAGNFSPDGRTYYGAEFGNVLYAIDVEDPAKPRLLTVFSGSNRGVGVPHDLGFSDDGQIAYVAQPGVGGLRMSYYHTGPLESDGLVILDVSEIQARKRDPQIKVLSSLYWKDGSLAQDALPLKIMGSLFVVVTDEAPGASNGLDGTGRRAACALGLPTSGFARIIDVSDPRTPKVASKLQLQVHDPKNCVATLSDTAGVVEYDSHYCAADNPGDARMLACSYFEAGIRVFDIRDPYRPAEIAYYKPKARPRETLAGSYMSMQVAGHDRTTDLTSSLPHWVVGPNGTFLWFTSQDGGFQVVKFTNNAAITEKSSFPTVRR